MTVRYARPATQSPRCFSASSDGCAYGWDLTTGKLVTTFKGTHWLALLLTPDSLGLPWYMRVQATAPAWTVSRTLACTMQWPRRPRMAPFESGVRHSCCALPLPATHCVGHHPTFAVATVYTDTRAGACSRVFKPVVADGPSSRKRKGQLPWLGAVACDTTSSWLVRCPLHIIFAHVSALTLVLCVAVAVLSTGVRRSEWGGQRIPHVLRRGHAVI